MEFLVGSWLMIRLNIIFSRWDTWACARLIQQYEYSLIQTSDFILILLKASADLI